MPGKTLLRSHHALFAAVSAAACLLGYSDVVFGGKTFLPIGVVRGAYPGPPFAAGYAGKPARVTPEFDGGAEAWFVHPLAYHERRALAAGTLPFWNAHNGFGWPMLPDGQIATFSPLHWIELIDPDQPALWDLHQLLLRFVVALSGCYLLHLLGSPAAVAALAAPFGALHGTFTALVVRHDLNPLALFPVLLCALILLFRQPRAGVAAALCAGLWLTVTAGHPEPSAGVLVALVFVAAVLPVRAEPAVRMRIVALTGAAAAIALLLAAPYWLPLLYDIGSSWSIHDAGVGARFVPAFSTVQWLVPAVYAIGGSPRAFLDPPSPPFGFVGVVAGTLAFAGVVTSFAVREARGRIPLAAAALALLLVVLGIPPLSFVTRLPLLSRMPVSYYFFPMLYLLGLCGLGAIGDLAHLGARGRIRAVVYSAAAALALVLLAPILHGTVSPFYRLQVAATACVAAGTALVAWQVAGAQSSRARALLCAVIGVLVFAELRIYRYPLSDRGNPTALPGYARWLAERQATDPPFRVMGLGDWMLPNYASAFGLEDVRLCDALVPPEYMALITRWFDDRLRYGWLLFASPEQGFRIPERMLNAVNVRFLVGDPSSIPEFVAHNRVVYRDEEMGSGAVIENLGAWPRIFAVTRPHLQQSAASALERIGQLDAGKPFAVVQEEDFPRERWKRLCGECAGRDVAQRISGIRRGINDLTFTAEVDGPAVLVVSETLSPGWRAWVDGVEQPIFHANYLFRGLLVEGGQHRIRFEFRPRGWTLSLWLAAAGLLLCAAVSVSVWLRHRTSHMAVADASAAKLSA